MQMLEYNEKASIVSILSITLSRIWDGSVGEKDGQFELEPKRCEMGNWLQKWMIHLISLELLHQESKLFCAVTFLKEKKYIFYFYGKISFWKKKKQSLNTE